MVEFFFEDVEFSLSTPDALKSWISNVIGIEQGKAGNINFIFCSDTYLLDINQTYLKHDTYTDIISFDQSNSPDTVAGDIYISIDRVRVNATEFEESFNRELKRVMVHGVLHLLGYNDKSAEQQHEMRKKEEAYLSL